jgi:hypothetical protein
MPVDEEFEKEKLMDAIEYEGFTTWELLYTYNYEEYVSHNNIVDIQSCKTDYISDNHQELNKVLCIDKGEKVEVWGKFIKYIGWDKELVEIRYKKVEKDETE